MKRSKIFRLIFLFSSLTFLIAAGKTKAQQPDAGSNKLAMVAEAKVAPEMVVKNPEGILGKISLDLRNIDIVDALKYLSMKTGLNIITTKSVTGRATLMVQEVLIKDVFDIMLRSNNLAYDKQGEIYNVMTQEEYKALYGKHFSDVRQVKVLYLKYTIPEQAFNLLDMLKSDIGRVLVDPESGNVLVMDSAERIKIMERVLQDFEEKNTVRVFKLNYAKAKDVEEVLKNQLDLKKVGLIKADEKGNQIVVQTLTERMEQIEKLVQELDQKTKEIIVDVNIVNVKLSDETTEGIRWEGLFDLGRRFGLSYLGSVPFSSVQASSDAWKSRSQTFQDVGYVGSYPFSGTTSNYSTGKQSIGTEEMHLGIVGRQDFDVIIKYLQTLGKTKIISNPKLAVVNNQEAKIHVGQKEAYVTTTTTTGQTTNTISEQVTFVDVGVIISVVPAISNDGFITLKIKAEVNSVLDTLITPSKNQIPIIDTSLAETTVMVKDGSTIIIGGLKKERDYAQTLRTPFLGAVPVLGKLFSSTTKEKERTELLVILTPKLISGEVLVSGSGLREVGQTALKPAKGYLPVKKDAFEQTFPFVSSEESQNLQLKGPK